jgi:hypothetical protein
MQKEISKRLDYKNNNKKRPASNKSHGRLACSSTGIYVYGNRGEYEIVDMTCRFTCWQVLYKIEIKRSIFI